MIDCRSAVEMEPARWASLVTQKPGGTGRPARASRPRLRPLPPTAAPSSGPISSKVRMSGIRQLLYLVLETIPAGQVRQVVGQNRGEVDAPPLDAAFTAGDDRRGGGNLGGWQ